MIIDCHAGRSDRFHTDLCGRQRRGDSVHGQTAKGVL